VRLPSQGRSSSQSHDAVGANRSQRWIYSRDISAPFGTSNPNPHALGNGLDRRAEHEGERVNQNVFRAITAGCGRGVTVASSRRRRRPSITWFVAASASDVRVPDVPSFVSLQRAYVNEERLPSYSTTHRPSQPGFGAAYVQVRPGRRGCASKSLFACSNSSERNKSCEYICQSDRDSGALSRPVLGVSSIVISGYLFIFSILYFFQKMLRAFFV
jgi:hypothetical protein